MQVLKIYKRKKNNVFIKIYFVLQSKPYPREYKYANT